MPRFINASADIGSQHTLEQFWDALLNPVLPSSMDGPQPPEFDWTDPESDGKLVDSEAESFGSVIAKLLADNSTRGRSGCRIIWSSNCGDGCHFSDVESDSRSGLVVVRHVSLDGGGHSNLIGQPVVVIQAKLDGTTWSNVELLQAYDGPIFTGSFGID